jgi:hypothetical protein
MAQRDLLLLELRQWNGLEDLKWEIGQSLDVEVMLSMVLDAAVRPSVTERRRQSVAEDIMEQHMVHLKELEIMDLQT